MYERSKYLVKGCTKPLDGDLEEFYRAASAQCASLHLPSDFQVRWIGADTASTEGILAHIRSGAKTGTVSVPQAVELSGQAKTQVGDCIVLINFDGTPAVLVRITDIEIVPYAEISERHTGLDGPKVRALDVWKPLHYGYFNMLLSPFGLTCNDQTPIAFEKFELLYSAVGDADLG